MKPYPRILAACLTLLFAGQNAAYAKGKGNVDAFLDRKDQKPLAVSAEAALARGAKIQHVEERLGVPTFVFAEAKASAGARSGLAPAEAARSHLQANADLYRLSSADVASAELKSMHDTGKGPRIARFTQSVQGVEVFRNELKVVMDRNNDLVAISGYLAPSASVKAASAQTNAFRVSSSTAVARAISETTGQAVSAQSLASAAGNTEGGYAHFQLDASSAASAAYALATPARVKKVYFTMPDGLVPAYYVEVNAGLKSERDAEYASYVVSAVDGSLLFRNDLRARESFSYRTFASANGATDSMIPFDGPHGTALTPHPTGTPNNLNDTYVPQELVTLPNYLPSHPGDFWLPANATQTTGNNVDAYADLAAPDGFQVGGADMRAETTGTRTFDYGYDISKAPDADATQSKAAIVNLFYVNNWLHDFYYDAGFNEAAGNAQASNYGRGGLENDSIRAEAQDYLSRNNANMSTPADGARPRMQMYLFNAVSAADIVPVSPSNYTILSNQGAIGDDAYDLTAEVAVTKYTPALADGGAGTVETIGCTAPFDNAAQLAGKIALIDRGVCPFSQKALNAQAAGAIAVIIANNVDSRLIPAGVPDGITIPVMGIPKSSGDRIKAKLAAGPVTVQMVRTEPGQDRDGTLDNDVVAHEWGHYISNRLIGNSAGLTNNQGRSMGEGWGDFNALMMQVRESDRMLPGNDRYQGVYVSGGWVTSGAGANGHYYGIRRVPYTTDMTKNALTLKHIENGIPLPSIHPTNGGEAGRANSEVHNSGEVWATMLWECYASLLNAHPFQEAQDRMKRYLVASFKATPNAPTILEARDAVLAVALASDPADYQRFVAAFAKRGAGFGAKVPNRDSQDHIGTVESYATGQNLVVESATLDDSEVGCDSDGYLDLGETGRLTVTVRNTGADLMPAFSGKVTTSSTTAVFSFNGDDTLDFPALARGQSATASIRVSLTGITAAAGVTPRGNFSIAFDAAGIPASSATYLYSPRVHVDEVANATANDSVDPNLTGWTSSLYRGMPAWQRPGYPSSTGAVARTWLGPNLPVAGEITLTSPWIKVGSTDPFQFLFTYRHSFETDNGGVAPYFDGAVLEFTLDGLNWEDITQYAYGKPTDLQQLEPSGDNPLAGAIAFAGLSTDYPAFTVGGVNFGNSIANQNIRFRFRIGSDGGVGAYGFEIDTIQVSGAATPLPFTGYVVETSNGSTCNRKPVAEAGLNRNYNEFSDATLETRTVVTLNGTGSFDPDGNPITYQWRQLNGPPVALSANDVATPSFTADVAETTLYTFQLIVNDGTESSAPKEVVIGIINNNHLPVVTAEGPAKVNEGAEGVTLTATATDADGEPLSYAWVQTSGPEVELTGADTASATFTAPVVSEDVDLTFEVSATDPYASVASNTVTVKVHDNRQPTVTTEAAVSVDERATATLTAVGADAEDGTDVKYLWSQIGGPFVALQERTAATLSFTAPDVAANTELRFNVVAVDTLGEESIPAVVTVTVHDVNRAPTASITVRGSTVSEGTVVLDGSASSDPDGSGLTYAWRQTGGPTVQLSTTTGSVVTFTAPKLTKEKSVALTFELTVKDPGGLSGTQSATATITKAPDAGGCSTTNGSPASLMFPLMGLAAWAFASRRRRSS